VVAKVYGNGLAAKAQGEAATQKKPNPLCNYSLDHAPIKQKGEVK